MQRMLPGSEQYCFCEAFCCQSAHIIIPSNEGKVSVHAQLTDNQLTCVVHHS